MKKCIYCLVLACISQASFAQNAKTNAEKIFEIPDNHAKRRFLVDLGSGNKLQLELTSMDDLKKFRNMDSVIRVFQTDIAVLKDSLSNEITAKRIDYTTDAEGRKKIRFQQYFPVGSTFVVQDGEPASLKLEQDTINFVNMISYREKHTLKRPVNSQRYFKISFFLNDISDLEKYRDGSVSQKIETLIAKNSSRWSSDHDRQTVTLDAEPTISARLPKGYIAGGDYLNLRASVDIQNYKSYFVPSFSLAAGIIFSTTHWKQEVLFSWDPHFLFGKDSQGKLRTYRNDFLTMTLGHGPLKDNDTRKDAELLATVSLGYLIKRSGEYYDKNTFRFGMGRLSLFGGRTKIEPVFYFNNFFKGITPGIRLIQSF